MPSLIPGYEYDIFISYRHKDNRYEGWVSEFVANLRREPGEAHVYLQPRPSNGLKWQISTEGGSEEARLSQDGKKIFYCAGREWMEVSVSYTPSFSFSTPKVLFDADYINVNGYSYDILKGGPGFLLLKGSSERQSHDISIIQGWFDELDRLVAPSIKNNS